MVVAWSVIISIVLCGLVGAGYAISCAVDACSNKGRIAAILSAIAVIVVAFILCFGVHWFLYNTESGARAIKDWNSNTQGGIERTVTVYDMEGDIISEYSGKFDVESDDTKIKFDDEDGKRHIIYFTTGTVIIEEN